MRGLIVVRIGAVIADLRVGQDNNLSRIRGIGKDFLVTGDGSIENNFPGDLSRIREVMVYVVGTLTLASAIVYALDWSPTGKQIISGDPSGSVLLWDADAAEPSNSPARSTSTDATSTRMARMAAAVRVASSWRSSALSRA